MATTPTNTCMHFQRGNCFHGKRCRFSHEAKETLSMQPTRRLERRGETEAERICREWTYMIPMPGTYSYLSSHRAETSEIFSLGWRIVERGDTGTLQHVITKLATEEGLMVIKTLTAIMDACKDDHNNISIFRSRILPFYRIISHREVLSSLILETPVHTIYTFLFGPSGERALKTFRFTATALSGMMVHENLASEEFSSIAIPSTLAVLDRIIEINQTAQVIDGFITVVQTISACISEEALDLSAQHNLTRIRRRLNIGASLPSAPDHANNETFLTPTFELTQELPGRLSIHGARHDNDHANIADIHILPTAQEIASPRQAYIPSIDSNNHLTGVARLLDRQFRLLRQDTVGQLGDAAGEEVKRLENLKTKASTGHQHQSGVRRVTYYNAVFSYITMDRKNGLQFEIEFDQPPQTKNKPPTKREEWWKGSKLLQVDSLVCFVTATGKIIFLTVCDPTPNPERIKSESAEAKPLKKISSLFTDGYRATVLVRLAEFKAEDVGWVINHVGRSNVQQSLVEFPGVLLPTFLPTLQALQKMSRTLDIPFGDILTLEPAATTNKPPAYASKRGFTFKLDALAGGPLTLTPGKQFDYNKLNEGGILDKAQQFALVQGLSTALALIQGPPGTGKSYTGEAIIKTLIESRKDAKLGPIVCVCYTNHALDQLLEHLVKGEVRQIVRIGSRSKSELLQALNLQKVSRDVVPTKVERHDRWLHNQSIDKSVENVARLLKGLNNPKHWNNIRLYLQKRNPFYEEQLFGVGVNDQGWRDVKAKADSTLNSWLNKAPKDLELDRPIDQLSHTSLWGMSASERRALYNHWIHQLMLHLTDELISEVESYYKSRGALDKCYSEINLRCLREAHVIGVTTSGLARNIELLQRVQAKIMLCEEAGEVLEAHTLTALLPGIEHAILIGDHEQLRPQINTYELQHDNKRGEKYSLDVSLFERLVKAKTVPLSTLEIQRRMHPSISELIRVPLYPNLEDHPSVAKYPEVEGMRDRLYWLDHQEKEDKQAIQSTSLSRTNTFEVEMVAALVSHLVKQGTYKNEEVAIITPYLGQLQKIRRRLASSFEIVVGDRDQEDLEAKGLDHEPKPSGQWRRQVQKTTLLKALRVATVDNFQGEEAKIIVVSLVRCNDEHKCGFLKTSNRINVLLSRAQHGMYIIGNSDTSKHVPMWAKVISILEQSNNIGRSLALCCPRHKNIPIGVSVPDDFSRLSPEGGCNKKCVSRLECGHSCPNMCHSESLHMAVRCLERCHRPLEGCEHECPRPCGDECGKCQKLVLNTPLPCGHIERRLKCHEAQDPGKVQCQVLREQTLKHCEHQIRVRCHELPLNIDYPCPATCRSALLCGHNCARTCKDCKTTNDGVIVEINHGSCKTQCGRPYTTCSHSCKTPCHGKEPCSPCESPCGVRCNHSKCCKLCNEPCVPCAQDCSWSCPHRGRCELPCAIPCDLLPCSERCPKTLKCGHQCPSICGEICRGTEYCQVCAQQTTKEMVVDFILSSTFEEVDPNESPCIIPPCGHILTVESMDGHMSMSDFYTMNADGEVMGVKHTAEPFSASELKSCPTCRGPLRDLNRYSRIVRRALIDESTKKFIVWANLKFVNFEMNMQALETELRESSSGPSRTRSAGVSRPLEVIRLDGLPDHQVSQIELFTPRRPLYKSLIGLRKDIRVFLQQVGLKEQPFGRIFDLAKDARRHRGVDTDLSSGVNVLQVRSSLLTAVLLTRCDYSILVAFLNDHKDHTNIEVDFHQNRKKCETLIVHSNLKHQPGSAVEGHLYWARFVALELSLPNSNEELTPLVEEARGRGGHLQLARAICDEYPGQTRGMENEVEEVEIMLRGSTFYLPVTNKEKAAVYAAMQRDFGGTGHWYYCENGHPFTVGECGMPMETAQCPQCAAPVGGRHHQAVAGVARAIDMDEQFGRMRL